MPITWQNINAPSNADAMRGFAIAGQNFSTAFDKVGGMIKDTETFNQGVLDRTEDTNVLALKEALSRARTPEEVASLQGQLEAMRAGLGTRGRTAVLGAEDARVASLQTQIGATNAFNDNLGRRQQTIALNAINDPVAVANAVAAAENAPISRELVKGKLLQEQALAPVANATALQVAANAGRAATFAGEQAPLLEANAVTEAKLRGKTLTVQQKQTQDTLEDQNLTAITAQTAAAYQASQMQDRIKLGGLAARRGFPVDAAGAPDISKMTSAQLTQLNADAGLAGLRSTKDLFGGDTKAMNGFAKQLQDNGFSPEAIARNQAKINGAFNSTANGAPVGNDALNNATEAAKIDVVMKERDTRNWYAPGSNDALNAYETIAKEIGADPSFETSKEDLPHVQRLLHKMATEGIKTKDGRYVVPSKDDVLAAVRSTYEGWNIRNRGRAEDIEKYLAKTVDTPRVTDLLKQAEESKSYRRQQAVKEILSGGPAPAKK